eukprot:scaffold24_cov341-Pavlova_lutheri.AAC.2
MEGLSQTSPPQSLPVASPPSPSLSPTPSRFVFYVHGFRTPTHARVQMERKQRPFLAMPTPSSGCETNPRRSTEALRPGFDLQQPHFAARRNGNHTTSRENKTSAYNAHGFLFGTPSPAPQHRRESASNHGMNNSIAPNNHTWCGEKLARAL